MDYHASVWPFESGIWTLPQCGPSSPGGATPRVLGRQLPPPPPRGLRPTVSCQRYEPKEPTGAEGAQWGYVATLPTCGPFSDSAPRSEAVGIP